MEFGDWETHVIVIDGTAVVEARWSRPAEMPPIGTNVVITGKVMEFEGNIYMTAIGSGAMEWDAEDLPEIIDFQCLMLRLNQRSTKMK